MKLNELKRGDKFRINKITIKQEIGKRLVDMGLNQGVEGKVLRCALFGDPIEIFIRGYNISLRKSEAGGVDVELIEHGRRRHRHGAACGCGSHN